MCLVVRLYTKVAHWAADSLPYYTKESAAQWINCFILPFYNALQVTFLERLWTCHFQSGQKHFVLVLLLNHYPTTWLLVCSVWWCRPCKVVLVVEFPTNQKKIYFLSTNVICSLLTIGPLIDQRYVQCLLQSVVQLKGKHCWRPIPVMGVAHALIKIFCRQFLLVSNTFPGFPSLGEQNCLL